MENDKEFEADFYVPSVFDPETGEPYPIAKNEEEFIRNVLVFGSSAIQPEQMENSLEKEILLTEIEKANNDRFTI